MISPVLIAFFLSALIYSAGAPLSFLLFFELILGSMAVLATGYSLFTLVKVNNLPCKNLVYLITGTFIASLFSYFMSASLGIPAGSTFLYFSLGILLFVLIFHSKSFFKEVLLNYQLTDLLVLLGLMGFTLLWCWQISASFPTLLSKGVLSTWIDAYYHGAQISQYSDMKSVGQGDIFLAGVPPFLYHRAIYMLPAAIADTANLSGLAAATALLLPMGFLLLAMTIYCLVSQLANRMAGALAAILLLVFPDNSWLGLKNGFLGFRYVVQVAPGTSYGLAGCLTSLLFFVMWLRDKSINTLFLSLFFAVSVYFFRAHFFVLYFPVLIISLICVVFCEKKYYWQSMGLLFASALILMCVLAAKNSAVVPFLKLVHLERGVSIYSGFYQYIVDLNQPILTIFTGMVLLVGGILGIWMVIYPLLLFMKIRQFGWEKIDYVPLILLLCYVGLVLFAPALYQTYDEFQHRPSGLLYAVFIIFSVFCATKVIDNQKWPLFTKYAQPAIVGGAVLGVILTGLYPANYPLRVLFKGFSLYQDYQVPLDRSIIQAAMFLRNKAVSGEIFLTSKNDADLRNVDSAVVVSSIAGMPSYLGEQTVQSLRAELTRLSIIHYRDSIIRKSIVDASTHEEAIKIMRANHIAWYIALTYPKWDKLGKNSTFKNDSIALYHI